MPIKISKTGTGHTKFEEAKDWRVPQFTELSVRRVRTEDRDEAQIEIHLSELRGETQRHYSMHHSMCIPADQIPDLLAALTEIV